MSEKELKGQNHDETSEELSDDELKNVAGGAYKFQSGSKRVRKGKKAEVEVSGQVVNAKKEGKPGFAEIEIHLKDEA